MEEQQKAQGIAIHSQFIKDLSLEIPHAPEIFREVKGAPKIELNIGVKAESKGGDMYTSQLDIYLTGKTEDKTLFVLELCYMTYAEVNVPQEHLEAVLMIELPRLIFPFARNVITQCLSEGGLPPFMLNPIDFAALYLSRKQAEAQQNGEAQQQTPIQVQPREEEKDNAKKDDAKADDKKDGDKKSTGKKADKASK